MRHGQKFPFVGWVFAVARLAIWLLAAGGLGGPAFFPLNASPQVSTSARAAREPALQAVTERLSYNAGERVRLRLVLPPGQAVRSLDSYAFAVRYSGENIPLAQGLILGTQKRMGIRGSSPLEYGPLWKVPADARTGRYEVDLSVQDPESHTALAKIPDICSFVVHRQAVRIVSVHVPQTYYTSGDSIPCEIKLENLGDRDLGDLRLEFSERYWPWIFQQKAKIGRNIATLQANLNLHAHSQGSLEYPQCAVAGEVEEPAIRQYAAVVWNRDRSKVLAIAFTPLVFINPPGMAAPHPYPPQYVYPHLSDVNTTSYKEFHPESWGAEAIHFDTHHTQFPAGGEATLRFSVSNPTDNAWHQVVVRARLTGPDGLEKADQVVAEQVDLNPRGARLKQEVKLPLPPSVAGIFHAQVELVDSSGRVQAMNQIELGVNPLPKSVLMFCAHEDDEGAQMGFLRSLVENQVPLHVVYFTSGDAGSCDRYFQHSCGPEEALNFGAIRMQEARAALGHLGVPRADILFLGLPDGGSGKIWYQHPKSRDPYLAVLLASDHAPYEDLFRPNLPYARDAVVDAASDIIMQFHPEVIFTSHPPAEGHIDHIVNNYFVVKALQGLLREGAISPEVEVRVDRIFDPRENPATPYQYEDHDFYVSGSVVALAQEAGWFYESQGGNRMEGNLRTWKQLQHTEGYRKMLDWKDHEGWNEKEQ